MSWLDWIRGRQGEAGAHGEPPERWLVLDVETTGLDPAHDHLLAIAALAVRVDWRERRLSLHPGDSLAMTICPEKTSDKTNVLIHGIGIGTQRQGMPPAQAMAAFRDWIGDARLVAYHASFDRTLLGRYAKQYLGQDIANEWLDIAHLCTVAYPDIKARALDDWLDHFSITCLARHEATADVMAECDLLQRIWPRIARECGNWRDVRKYASQHNWFAGR